jgi:hypothetical protein
VSAISDVLHELIDVACGRKPILPAAEADALHLALHEAESVGAVFSGTAQVSQEPQPEIPAEGYQEPQGSI